MTMKRNARRPFEPGKAEAVFLASRGRFGIDQWVSDAADEYQRWVEDTVAQLRSKLEHGITASACEALRIASAERANVSFALDTGDDHAVLTDATLIDITLPFGESEYEGPTWRVSLRDAVKFLLSGSADNSGRLVIDEDDPIARVRNGLAELIQTIDDAVTKGSITRS